MNIMSIFARIWTGVVAAVAGIALAVLAQVIGQMTLGWQMDSLKWTVSAFAGVGFLLGAAIGPRSTKAPGK